MKIKRYLLGLSLILTSYLYAADINVQCSNWFFKESHQKHNHKYYELCYIDETLCPEYVIWTLSNDEAIEAEAASNRTNDFRPCVNTAKLSDFYKTGFDRGHMCPNADMDFSSEAASETFRLCNMCPQSPQFNRGPWKKLEQKDRQYAKKYGKIDIICGPIFLSGKSRILIGRNNVRVPDGFFRIFYNKESNFLECYILWQSDKEIPNPVTLEKIESRTGLQFKKL